MKAWICEMLEAYHRELLTEAAEASKRLDTVPPESQHYTLDNWQREVALLKAEFIAGILSEQTA